MRRFLNSIFLFVLLLHAAIASGHYRKIVQYVSGNGLPSNTAYQCIEDKTGFIWIATDAGLSRFDGKSFTNFTVRDGLPDNEIIRIQADDQNRIWITCFNRSVSYYDPARQKIINEGEEPALRSHLPSKYSAIPIGTVRFPYRTYQIQAIDSQLYYATDNGVYIFNRDSTLQDSLLSGINVGDIFSDKRGNRWYSTIGNGVFCELKNTVQVFNKSTGLSSNNTHSILVNGENIFVGNDIGGIDVLRHGRLIRTINISQQYVHCIVRSLSKTSEHRIMAITDFGAMMSLKDDPFQFEPWKRTEPQTGLSLNKAFSEDSAHKVFMIGGGRDLLLWNNATNTIFWQLHKRITSVYADRSGNYWFGSIDGLHQIDSQAADGYTSCTNLSNILGNTIADITGTSDGILWVATHSYGVVAILPNKHVVNINEPAGLISDNVHKVFADEARHNLWVATYRGLSKVHYKMTDTGLHVESVHNFTTTNGLMANNVNSVVVKDDTVYAATSQGLCVFRDEIRKEEIPIFFTRIKIENTEWLVKDSYQLDYLKDDIAVSFSGICYDCGGTVQFWYRLLSNNSDTSWKSTTDNTVEFAGLSPGHYTFEVKTSGGNRRAVHFYIKPPFWKAWYFYLMLGVLFVVALLTIYALRIKKIRKEEQERSQVVKQIANMELKLLQSQLNPHFIFNVLNSIQMYINVLDRKAANEYLVKVSKLMRLFLNVSKQAYNTLEDEIQILTLYCDLEKLRFEDQIDCKIIYDSSLPTKRLHFPSMLTQPFVENAINHGLLGKNEPGCLVISFGIENNMLRCIIEDDGVGREKAEQRKAGREGSRKSWGMQLCRERIEVLNKLNDGNIMLDVIDKVKDDKTALGTIVTISVPLRYL